MPESLPQYLAKCDQTLTPPPQQLSLFEVKAQPYKTQRSPATSGLALDMNREQLLAWQTEIANFQRSRRRHGTPTQQTLFNANFYLAPTSDDPAQHDFTQGDSTQANPTQTSLAQTNCAQTNCAQTNLAQNTLRNTVSNTVSHDSSQIDPWQLAYESMSFWRKPRKTRGYPCLYFVVDRFVPLLLYIGESINSEQRWRSEHDCKRYLDRYYALHYTLGIEQGVAIAFWLHAPRRRQSRQAIEQDLIQIWQPPFNKECWSRWGQPFGKN